MKFIGTLQDSGFWSVKVYLCLLSVSMSSWGNATSVHMVVAAKTCHSSGVSIARPTVKRSFFHSRLVAPFQLESFWCLSFRTERYYLGSMLGGP